MKIIKWNTGLLGKLISINLLVVLCAVGITWLALDSLAADYFMILMKKFNISSETTNAMFLQAVHRYLIWAGVGALFLAALLSLLLMKRVLGPLLSMNRLTKAMARGDFKQRVPQGTADEVGELARSFNEMAAALERLEALRRNMVIDVAHELRTPITNIQGYLESIQDGVCDASPEIVSLLHEETMRLNKLVNDLMELARADAARFEMNTERVDLRRLIQDELIPFRPRFDQKKIEFTLDSSPDEYWALADREKIRRVVSNLLDNALTYTPSNGWVKVRLASRDDRVIAKMENLSSHPLSGDSSLVFERFYRGEKSRSRQFGGAGLGLAIVKELIQAHGSKVEAQTQDGNFRISFSLPVAKP
jgi:two-component system sensor histidine kinase BaeS